MTNRDWFCLALQVFGIWLLISGVEGVASYAVTVISGLAGSPFGVGDYFAYYVTWIIWNVLRTVIGLVVLLFAPAIAARFYPGMAVAETTPPQAAGQPLEQLKPLKVGIQLLGVYSLLLAVESASGVVIAFLSGEVSGFVLGADVNPTGGYLASLLPFGLNLAFAAILLIWNERVVFLIEKFR